MRAGSDAVVDLAPAFDLHHGDYLGSLVYGEPGNQGQGTRGTRDSNELPHHIGA